MADKELTGKRLIQRIKSLIEKRAYRTTGHFQQRERERKVFLWEALHVLKNGSHEEDRDEWDHKNQIWKYSIRGRTIDSCELRVVVSIVENFGLLLITVYKIGKS